MYLSVYKQTHLDIDVNNKSDRIEWGHARYQATFRPDQAYEMCIQWAVASGNIVAELVTIFINYQCDTVYPSHEFYKTKKMQ